MLFLLYIVISFLARGTRGDSDCFRSRFLTGRAMVEMMTPRRSVNAPHAGKNLAACQPPVQCISFPTFVTCRDQYCRMLLTAVVVMKWLPFLTSKLIGRPVASLRAGGLQARNQTDMVPAAQ